MFVEVNKERPEENGWDDPKNNKSLKIFSTKCLLLEKYPKNMSFSG